MDYHKEFEEAMTDLDERVNKGLLIIEEEQKSLFEHIDEVINKATQLGFSEGVKHQIKRCREKGKKRLHDNAAKEEAKK